MSYLLLLSSAVSTGVVTPYSPYQEYFPYMDFIPNPYVKVDSLGIASHTFDDGPNQTEWEDPRINWMFYVKLMIGVSTPNGYELGIPYHNRSNAIGSNDYTIYGGESDLFTCDPDTGMITLTDAASVTTGGTVASPVTYSFEFNTPDGSTFVQEVIVLDGTLSTGRGSAGANDWLFYDGTSGNDANDGTEPHKPKQTLPSNWTTDFTEYVYLKQGSVFTDDYINIWTTPIANKFYAYGSPMTNTLGSISLTPQWETIVPTGFSGTTNTSSCVYRKNSNMSNVVIHGMHANANGEVIRGLSFDNSSNITFVGCRVSNNINDANSQGFGFSNCNSGMIAWSHVDDGVYGDGIYTINCDSFARVFCTAGYPGGSVADNFQNSHEESSGNFGTDFCAIGNIGFQEYNASGSQKGSEAFSGIFRSLHWLNLYYANRFNIGTTCFDGLVTNEYSINKAAPTFLRTYAVAAEHPGGSMHYIANFGGGGGPMFGTGGFSDENMQGDEFLRTNLSFRFNVGWLNSYGVSGDRKWSGDLSHNYFFGNTVRTEDLKDKTYSLTGDILSIERYESGGNFYMRVTTVDEHFISKDDVVTISGSDHAGNNGTFTVYADSTTIPLKQFTAFNNSSGDSSNSGMTYTSTAESPTILQDDIVSMTATGQSVAVLPVQDHNLKPGQYVIQSGCANSVNNGVKKIDSIYYNFSVTKYISNIAVSGTTVTVTTTSSHGFFVGKSIRMSNCATSNNGNHIITSTPTSTTFTYEDSTATAEGSPDPNAKAVTGVYTYTYTEQNGTPVTEAAPASGSYIAVQDNTLQVRGNQYSAPLIKDFLNLGSVPSISGMCSEGEEITLTIPTLSSGYSLNKIIWLRDQHEITELQDDASPIIPAGLAGTNDVRPVMTQSHGLFSDIEKYHLGCIVEIINNTTGYITPLFAQWDDGLMWRVIGKTYSTPDEYTSDGVVVWSDPDFYQGDDDSDVSFWKNQADDTNNFVNLSGSNMYKFHKQYSSNGRKAIVAEDTTARYLQLEKSTVIKYLYVVFIYKNGTTSTFDASNRRLIGGDGSFDARRVISNSGAATFIPGGIYAFDASGTIEMNGSLNSNVLPTGVKGKIIRLKSQNTAAITALAVSGTTATATVASTSSLAVGMYILQAGFANSVNNGEKIITAIPGGTTYQYEDASAIAEGAPGSATYSAGYKHKFALGTPTLSASGVIDGAYLGIVGVDREVTTDLDDAILDYYSNKYGITSTLSTTPKYSFDVLDTGTFPAEITVDRNSVAAYRDATGKYKNAAINVGRVHHSPSGAIIGAISETAATRKNTYAFPESGVVTDHFTTGTSDITVVTDNDVPMSSDYTNYNKVWQIDNSAGSGPVTYKFAGTTGSTSPHSMQCWCKIVSGDGYAYLTIGGRHSVYGLCPITSRTGAEIGAVEVHPATTSDQLEITLPAGMVVNVSVANMQRHLSVDNNKATGYLTTPILHGPGTQATRDDEFLYITTPASLGFDEDQGTIVMHGSFVGAENTNSGCLSLYKTTDATNEYMYLRASPNGDWLWYGKGGGVESVNMVLPATASRREEYPLDISFAIRWSNVNGFRGTYHQKDVGTDASVNTATGIDRLAFYRHDVGTRDDSCLVITKFQIYDVELDNDEMDALSHREYGYVGVTVAQSNADIRKRGFPLKRADALTTKAPGSSTLILDYPHHGILSPGGKITIAGATTVDGITATQINTICTITAIVDEDTLEFDVASDVATSGSVTGGGANMTVTFYQNSNTGGPDWISTRLYEQFLPNPIIIRGPNYWDGTTNLDYGGGALAKSTGAAGVGYWVDDDNPFNLKDGTDLALLINTVRYDYGVYGRVDDFHVDLGPYEEGRSVSEIGGIIKQCMQYFVTRLKEIGGSSVNINFQMWSKRFNTNDDITWAWREMLREIAAENTNVYIIAEPYQHDLDPNSNAHFDSEVGYVKTYLAGDRQILKRNGFDLGMTDLPELSSAEYVSGTNQIVLTFTIDDNTTLSSGNTTILAQMFQVLVDSVESAVTVASVSGNQVTLTISDTITGANSVNVAYPYRLIDYDQDASDENDAGTAALVDSGPYSLPVRQFNSVASVV